MEDDSDSCIEVNDFKELVGQKHLFWQNKPLFAAYYSLKNLPSLILYGPPGVGKTTYAKLLAKKHNMSFVYMNATDVSLPQLKSTLKTSSILLVIDEIHRFDKRQQDVLLPYLENGKTVLIGTSTYNPYFKLTKALRSRCFVYEFKPLMPEELKDIAYRVCKCLDVQYSDNLLNKLIMYANHDARRLINMIKMVQDGGIDEDELSRFFGVDAGYDNETQRYDLISAFIKSIRGSDADAAVYYLARLIKANEDPEFIARRLCILASEDVGLADNNAVNLASSTLNAVKDIGLPECSINLAHCTIYLAKAKKSNSTYMAIKKALSDIEGGFIMDVPEHLKSHPTKPYLYPHNYRNSYVEQKYTLKKVKYFEQRENDKI